MPQKNEVAGVAAKSALDARARVVGHVRHGVVFQRSAYRWEAKLQAAETALERIEPTTQVEICWTYCSDSRHAGNHSARGETIASQSRRPGVLTRTIYQSAPGATYTLGYAHQLRQSRRGSSGVAEVIRGAVLRRVHLHHRGDVGLGQVQEADTELFRASHTYERSRAGVIRRAGWRARHVGLARISTSG